MQTLSSLVSRTFLMIVFPKVDVMAQFDLRINLDIGHCSSQGFMRKSNCSRATLYVVPNIAIVSDFTLIMMNPG